MRYREEPAPWDDGEYNTGRTKPPKSHRTLIALLLIAIIILTGISTLLGFSNLRLFRQLSDQTICYGTAQEVPAVTGNLVAIDAVQEDDANTQSFPELTQPQEGMCLQDIYN